MFQFRFDFSKFDNIEFNLTNKKRQLSHQCERNNLGSAGRIQNQHKVVRLVFHTKTMVFPYAYGIHTNLDRQCFEIYELETNQIEN